MRFRPASGAGTRRERDSRRSNWRKRRAWFALVSEYERGKMASQRRHDSPLRRRAQSFQGLAAAAGRAVESKKPSRKGSPLERFDSCRRPSRSRCYAPSIHFSKAPRRAPPAGNEARHERDLQHARQLLDHWRPSGGRRGSSDGSDARSGLPHSRQAPPEDERSAEEARNAPSLAAREWLRHNRPIPHRGSARRPGPVTG